MSGGWQRAVRRGRATAGFALLGSAIAALAITPLAAEEPAESQAAWDATVAAVEAVELTPAGYQAFRSRFDERHVPFAQRHTDFNPRRVAVSQGPSKVFVWHYSYQYFNRDGPALKPVGQASPRQLVAFMAGRWGVCCGINWFIDRDARVFRLAPLNAKLRHNPPYDRVVTGVEVEAGAQELVTTEQYEQLAYLTIHVLRRQGHLPTADPLRRVVRGHGEMRDAYLERNPGARWDDRDDFDEPVATLLRQKVKRYLADRAANETGGP